jgi:superfamily II DNA/RNA helicase
VQFSDFAFAEPIDRAIAEMGYVTPTPIQAQAIPVVLQGHDVMGAAQTGTGKTAGFALPILQRLLPLANTSVSPARHPVRALVLAPTRELADQIHVNVCAYAKYTPLRVAVVFGGVDIKPQLAALRQGCEVLIATPGRLLDHVEQKSLSLSQVQVLVLDEADRMLDMGFLPDIQRIMNLLPAGRQNLMFSATFSGDIRKLAESILRHPKSIEVARRNALADNIEQTVYRVSSEEAKRLAVSHLVRERGLHQVLVFTNTRIGAGRLARQLIREGLSADAIHGDKSQQERLATLEAFKQGKVTVLVATDVAARGLDIVELPAVINYDLPYSPEDYVHRIGRTGRAGASGMALSLMTESDGRYLAEIEKLSRRKFDPQPLALAPPLAGAERDDSSASPDDRTSRSSGAFGSARGSGASGPMRGSGASGSMRGSGASGSSGTSRALVAGQTSEINATSQSSQTWQSQQTSSNSSTAPSGDSRSASRRGARSPALAVLPGHSSDPFFFKPYQPAEPSEGSAAKSAPAEAGEVGFASEAPQLAQAVGHDVTLPPPRFLTKAPSRPLAALLGGTHAVRADRVKAPAPATGLRGPEN